MTKKAVTLIICLYLLMSGVVYGADPVSVRLQSFVSGVYHDYAAGSFEAVYAVMYPGIKAMISEGEYVAFQEDHFEQLSLQLQDIEVGEVGENPKLVRSLRQILSENEDIALYAVDISYTARFVRGVRFNQKISKMVYVALVDPGTPHESIYLLWDPSSMEETDSESD